MSGTSNIVVAIYSNQFVLVICCIKKHVHFWHALCEYLHEDFWEEIQIGASKLCLMTLVSFTQLLDHMFRSVYLFILIVQTHWFLWDMCLSEHWTDWTLPLHPLVGDSMLTYWSKIWDFWMLLCLWAFGNIWVEQVITWCHGSSYYPHVTSQSHLLMFSH